MTCVRSCISVEKACSPTLFKRLLNESAEAHFSMIVGLHDYRLVYKDLPAEELLERISFFDRLSDVLICATGVDCHHIVMLLAVLYHDGHLTMHDPDKLPAFLEIVNGTYIRPVYGDATRRREDSFYKTSAPLEKNIKENDLQKAVVSTVVDLAEISRLAKQAVPYHD